MSDIAALVADNLDVWTGAIERKSGAGRGGGKRINLYGIDRLRALILDLAVRGKLVPQDAGDEPASNLLARISLRKERLVGEGVIRKSKSPNRIVLDSEPFEAPHGWAFSSLGAVAEKLTDGSHNPPSDAGHGYPMLSSQNVFDGQIAIDAPSRWVSKEGFEKENARTNIQPNDVLLTIVASIGRSAVVTENLGPFVLQRSVAVISSQLYPEFLSLSFQAPFCANYMWQHAKGTAQKGIYLGKLAMMPLPIPPLPEQKRIVAKVDELMALCDALERDSAGAMAAHQALVEILLATLVNSADAADLARDWARLERHFDTIFTTDASINALKQTILDLAVRGKLVEQDAGDEPASKLLARIRSQTNSSKRTGKIGRSQNRTPLNFPFSTTSLWEWSTLGELFKDMRYGTSKKCDRDDSLTPVLRIPNVSGGTVNLDDMKFGPLDARERSDLQLQEGDLLIIRSNGSLDIVGRFAIVPDLENETAFAGYLVRGRLDQSCVVPKYIWHVSNSAWIRRKIEGPIRHGVGLKNLNLTELSALPIPIPPLAEQHRIVAKVDALLALCDALKARLADAAQTQRHLADAITQRAAA